jgi:hypothetical protein
MSANPRIIWIPKPAEVLLAERYELSPSKSQRLAFDASPNALSPKSTDLAPTFLTVQSTADTISPKLNESPFKPQFSYVFPIPGDLTTSQTTLDNSAISDLVRGSLYNTFVFSSTKSSSSIIDD